METFTVLKHNYKDTGVEGRGGKKDTHWKEEKWVKQLFNFLLSLIPVYKIKSRRWIKWLCWDKNKIPLDWAWFLQIAICVCKGIPCPWKCLQLRNNWNQKPILSTKEKKNLVCFFFLLCIISLSFSPSPFQEVRLPVILTPSKLRSKQKPKLP